MSRSSEMRAGLPKNVKRRKNLRHNAREAQDYFTQAPPQPPIFSYRGPGRGQSGESSN